MLYKRFRHALFTIKTSKLYQQFLAELASYSCQINYFKCFKNAVENQQKLSSKIDLQPKYSGSHPASTDCQKDSGSTVGNGTQVKPVLLTAIIFAVQVLRGLRPNLVKVVLFQLIGQWCPLDDATPSFFLNAKSPISGLSNDIPFVIFFLLEGG